MISCYDWWPWTKPGYITMTWRQSNNECSGGMAAHPAPKFPSAKIRRKSSRLGFFWDQESILLIDYLPKWQTINAECYSSLLVQLKDIFKEKSSRESHQGVLFLHDNTLLTGHLQPRRNWPTWASNILITHSILRIWPRRSTTCSLDWKNNWKVAIFRSTRRSLLPRGELLIFFFSCSQKLEQRAKKFIVLRGE